MIRRTSRTLLALIALLALGVFPWFFLTELPISALVATKEQNVPMRVYGLGTVEARIVSDVGLEVGATLIELTVGSGDAFGVDLAHTGATRKSVQAMTTPDARNGCVRYPDVVIPRQIPNDPHRTEMVFATKIKRLLFSL